LQAPGLLWCGPSRLALAHAGLFSNPYPQLRANPVPATRGRWVARRRRPCPTGTAPSAACWAWRSVTPRRANRRRSGAPPHPVERPRSGRTCVVACTVPDRSGLLIACALCSVQQSGHVRAFGPDSLPASGVFACLACRNCNAMKLPVTDCACQVGPDADVKTCLCCMWPVSQQQCSPAKRLHRLVQRQTSSLEHVERVGGQVLSIRRRRHSVKAGAQPCLHATNATAHSAHRHVMYCHRRAAP